MRHINPKLRDDLQLSQLDGAKFELMSPDTGAVLRLDSIGYLVAEQFEAGTLRPEEARERLEQDHGLSIDLDKVLEFLSRADELGFLEQPLSACGIEISGAGQKNEFTPGVSHSVSEELEKLREEVSGPFSFFRTISKKTWFFIVFLLLIVVCPWKFRVSGMMLIQPYEQAIIRASVSGKIEEIFVREGDPVTVGQKIARLHGYRTEIARKQSEINRVDAELKKLQIGATKEELNQVRKKVELAKKVAGDAEEKARRSSELYGRDLVPKAEYEAALFNRDIKLKQLEEQEAELNLWEHGTRPEVIKAKQAEKETLLIDLRLFQKLDQESLVLSPIDGVIATQNIFQLTGKQLEPGDSIVEVANLKKLTVKLAVIEQDIGHIHSGSQIFFKVQAIPEKTFATPISRISPVAEVGGEKLLILENRHFWIYGEIENKQLELKPGMTGVGQVTVGWRTIATIALRNVIRSIRVNFVI